MASTWWPSPVFGTSTGSWHLERQIPRRASPAGPAGDPSTPGTAPAERVAAILWWSALPGASRPSLGHGLRRHGPGGAAARLPHPGGAGRVPGRAAVRAANYLAGWAHAGVRVLPSLRARIAAACRPSPGTFPTHRWRARRSARCRWTGCGKYSRRRRSKEERRCWRRWRIIPALRGRTWMRRRRPRSLAAAGLTAPGLAGLSPRLS